MVQSHGHYLLSMITIPLILIFMQYQGTLTLSIYQGRICHHHLTQSIHSNDPSLLMPAAYNKEIYIKKDVRRP